MKRLKQTFKIVLLLLITMNLGADDIKLAWDYKSNLPFEFFEIQRRDLYSNSFEPIVRTTNTFYRDTNVFNHNIYVWRVYTIFKQGSTNVYSDSSNYVTNTADKHQYTID